MHDIELNDLTRWSPWPARLLGLEEFAQQKRDTAKIEQEYNREKFKACLDLYHNSGGKLDPVALRFSLERDTGERDAVRDGRLVAATLDELTKALFDTLIPALHEPIGRAATVVELGCAFGANLWRLAQDFPDMTFVGGDFSDNAITLAGKLYRDTPNINVGKLNFYDDVYPALEEAQGPVMVFTSQAIEQLPSVTPVLDTLARYADKITDVVHLEPAYDLHDDSLLGCLRRRYIELNDYNRDLISALKARSDIEIVDLQADVLGFNAFNALTLVHWCFK